MKNKRLFNALALLLLIGIAGGVFLSFPKGSLTVVFDTLAAQTQPVQIALAATEPDQNNATQLTGDYSGVVKLQVTVAGLFSDTLSTQTITDTPDLGTIDLALSISQTGNALSGYVSLDKTLVFSAEHTIQKNGTALKIGPTIGGSFDGTKLTILSEWVVATMGNQTIQRQFRLTGTTSQSDGGRIAGEYRETLWGATRQPITVIGAFTMQRVIFPSGAPNTSNKSPDAVADNASTKQGTAVTINVLANDSDSNGDPLTITSVSKPQFGTATTNGQSVVYTPNANFVGTDTLTYFVGDGKGGTTSSSITITVNGNGTVNQSPTAGNDSVTTAKDNAISIDVLANDSDPNGDSLSISIDGPPSHGTARVENGKILYTPAPGFVGTDSLTYIVSDGKGSTATATVTIEVTTTGRPGAKNLYLPLVAR